MTRSPKTIAKGEFAATALAVMEEKKITSLMVVDETRKTGRNRAFARPVDDAAGLEIL